VAPNDPVQSSAEVLDTGGGWGWSRAQRRAVLVLVLLALLTSAVLVLRDRDVPTSTPDPSPTAPPSPPATPRSSSTDPSDGKPVVLRRSGAVPAGLGQGTLFARSADTVFRVDLATGRVTATSAPVPTRFRVSFVPVPTGVVVRPVDASPGLMVPDDGAARPLRGLLGSAAQVLPATGGRLWVTELLDGRSSGLVLTTSDGTPTGTSIRENGYFLPDGSGGLLLVDSGGVYERVRSSWRRLAVGTALATGPNHYLLATCSGDVFCESVSLVRFDRERRQQQPVLADSDPQLPTGGMLSGDGRYLASLTTDDPDAAGNGRALVLELDTARVVKQMVVPTAAPGVTAVAAWSPDGRRLVGLDEGQLFVLNPATGSTTRPDLGLPTGTQLVQVALRADPSR
jgi:hypothetical protein